MDVAQVTELRLWADRLEERATNEEMRAAARAIHLLVDEVEDLQARLVVSEAAAPPPVPDEAAAPVPAEAEQAGPQTASARGSTLVARLRRTLGFE